MFSHFFISIILDNGVSDIAMNLRIRCRLNFCWSLFFSAFYCRQTGKNDDEVNDDYNDKNTIGDGGSTAL